MSFNDNAKQLFKKWTGLSVYKSLPIGLDALENVRRKLPHYKFKTFLDVGANVGQSATYIRHHFPESHIYCVEPIKDTFHTLQQNTKGLNLSYHNIALGSANEEVEVQVDVDNLKSDRNSLLGNHTQHAGSATIKTETVQVQTLQQFSKANGINFIDYLKIDTEGYDLEVLKGAVEMLESASIAFVEAEVSMNPHNTFHVDFIDVKRFLEKYNYMLFGIYEQIQERREMVPVLRRANVLFISGKLMA
ncbi:FkbM family methyltransferase [Pontibacter toksunensis]|uniref:FkbM family methyltransferase n=1 Tax=Pontibacter toksunensis TaxID=1332631 RepID=A0ABW6BSX6_9BACT